MYHTFSQFVDRCKFQWRQMVICMCHELLPWARFESTRSGFAVRLLFNILVLWSRSRPGPSPQRHPGPASARSVRRAVIREGFYGFKGRGPRGSLAAHLRVAIGTVSHCPQGTRRVSTALRNRCHQVRLPHTCTLQSGSGSALSVVCMMISRFPPTLVTIFHIIGQLLQW